MIEAQEEAEATAIDAINQTVIKIYELLDAVTAGKSSFKVQVEGYGLTKAGAASSGAQGGVQGASKSASGSGGGTGGSLGSGGVNSGGVSGSVDFGGWTTL